MEEYNFKTDVRGKEVKFRKWKVKDKKKFVSNSKDPRVVKDALVYDCIEDKNLALSEEEYKYLLFKIRETSLTSKVEFLFTCKDCNTEFDFVANLDEIMQPTFKEYGSIEVNGKIFEMGNIRNRDFYEQLITSNAEASEKLLADFILHIKSFDDNTGFTFDQMVEKIDDLDVEDFEKVFEKWEEMRFKVDNTYPVKCPNCGSEELYEFDALPGFFPESWEK
jgi:DNA-directed RNA polymerase subunit RPC12/RpoP